jgi:bifunctional N-acetylglucosamine-1-phosphate-uridyltransferase/glucosamine-1-phosphate-acetyltransferase GlmU-like protein
MVRFLIDALESAGVEDIAVVIGHGADEMRRELGDNYKLPFQEVRSGTADAVACAASAVSDSKHVFVFVGDSPLLTADSIRALHDAHIQASAQCSFLTAHFETLFPYARIIRGADGAVEACIEERDCTESQKEIRELLTSHFLFDTAHLFDTLTRVPRHPTTEERYLTDVIGLTLEDKKKVSALSIDNWKELVGLNTPEDVAWAEEHLKGS